MNEYQRDYNSNLRSFKLDEPPAPWQFVNFAAIGGLYEVGYGDLSDYLLVVSANGRGVFDGRTCERVARDYSSIAEAWYDPIKLTAEGIGPLAGQTIRLAGIHGGGLPTCSHDYWCLELVAPDWPNCFILLSSPTTFTDGKRDPEIVTKISPRTGDDTIVAFGFSPTGNSLVVAQSHTIEIFKRI